MWRGAGKQGLARISDLSGRRIDDEAYRCREGRGAGSQFIFMFPELDLIAVVTAHNKGMGNMLQELPKKLIPALIGNH